MWIANAFQDCPQILRPSFQFFATSSLAWLFGVALCMHGALRLAEESIMCYA